MVLSKTNKIISEREKDEIGKNTDGRPTTFLLALWH